MAAHNIHPLSKKHDVLRLAVSGAPSTCSVGSSLSWMQYGKCWLGHTGNMQAEMGHNDLAVDGCLCSAQLAAWAQCLPSDWVRS
jgi:hypothetical protein